MKQLNKILISDCVILSVAEAFYVFRSVLTMYFIIYAAISVVRSFYLLSVRLAQSRCVQCTERKKNVCGCSFCLLGDSAKHNVAVALSENNK